MARYTTPSSFFPCKTNGKLWVEVCRQGQQGQSVVGELPAPSALLPMLSIESLQNSLKTHCSFWPRLRTRVQPSEVYSKPCSSRSSSEKEQQRVVENGMAHIKVYCTCDNSPTSA